MNYRFFMVPVVDGGPAEEQLNEFLKRHSIAHVDRQFVADGLSSFWAISVGYWVNASQDKRARDKGDRKRVDYREILGDEAFRDYAALREWRKQVADREAIPVFGIFTNEQLAHIVRMDQLTKDGLRAIAGIGKTRVDRYGEEVLHLLMERRNERRAGGTPGDA